jgi:hypothetical protein
MQTASAPVSGSAQEVHFDVVSFGSASQQPAQHEAVRARHGSSVSQTTHHDGRTIRSVWRPSRDNALASGLGTR